MISEKEYKEMIKSLEKIKELTRKNKDIEKLCLTIKTTPRIQKPKEGFGMYSKEQKEEIRKRLIQICDLCLDLTQLELEYMKDIKKKDKISVEKIVIEGNFEECMEQLENANIPEEVKDLARNEIRKHFNK